MSTTMSNDPGIETHESEEIRECEICGIDLTPFEDDVCDGCAEEQAQDEANELDDEEDDE